MYLTTLFIISLFQGLLNLMSYFNKETCLLLFLTLSDIIDRSIITKNVHNFMYFKRQIFAFFHVSFYAK